MTTSARKSPINQAAQIEKQLILEILRGERVPDSSLPSLRTLALQYGVTLPTVQRVIDRLQGRGLVVVRRGSGVRVCDPFACADLSILPLWFEAFANTPQKAVPILRDFLEMRRVVAIHLLRTRKNSLLENAETLTRLSLRTLECESTDELAEADLALSQAFVTGSGQLAARSVFHASEAMVREVQAVRESIYGDREEYRKTIANILSCIKGGVNMDSLAQEVDIALREWDARSAIRFASR